MHIVQQAHSHQMALISAKHAHQTAPNVPFWEVIALNAYLTVVILSYISIIRAVSQHALQEATLTIITQLLNIHLSVLLVSAPVPLALHLPAV